MPTSRGPDPRPAGARAPSRQARPDGADATDSTGLARGFVVETHCPSVEPAPRDPSLACLGALDALARHGPPALLTTLARRPRVAASVASAIVARGEPDAVDALMSNPGAEIDRETFARALAARPGDDRLHDVMIARAALPPEIVQRLGVLISADRLPQLVRRHALPAASCRSAAGSSADASDASDAKRPPSRTTARGLTNSARIPANAHR
jgi:uncharacterized protein (DUF2336 family)